MGINLRPGAEHLGSILLLVVPPHTSSSAGEILPGRAESPPSTGKKTLVLTFLAIRVILVLAKFRCAKKGCDENGEEHGCNGQ